MVVTVYEFTIGVNKGSERCGYKQHCGDLRTFVKWERVICAYLIPGKESLTLEQLVFCRA